MRNIKDYEGVIMKALRLLPVLLLSFLFIGGFLVVIQVSGAPTSEIVVDTLDDELYDDGNCSLREAIAAANDNTSIDTCPAGQSSTLDRITFDVSGTITLTEQLTITIGGALEIDGGELITVSGNNSTRVFYVSSGAELTLQSVNIVDGYINTGNGGGIFVSEGKLNLNNSIITKNGSYGGIYDNRSGGGIYNDDGIVNITDSSIFRNWATSSGGGISSSWDGLLTIKNSTIYTNSSGEYGGGIHTKGTTSITNTSIYNNSAADDGGGIYNRGKLYITDSIISDNLGGTEDSGGYGGGIFNWGAGVLTIFNSTFTDNHANVGGGIFNYGSDMGYGRGTVYITNSTFSNNRADVSWDKIGGAIYNRGILNITESTIYGNHADSGGGINNGHYLTITNSTLYENHSKTGGAISNGGTMSISNCTLTNSDGGYAGGGIYSDEILTIVNTTLSGNSADGGGNIYLEGGSILTITNSIVAASLSGGNCSGTITDGGHNIDDGNTCGFTDGANTDPLLGPLQDNGGPTLTHDLLPGSPAIDSADPQHCPDTDQRGAPRPFDGDWDGEALCDIGSLEYIPGGFPYLTTTTINDDLPDPSLVNQPITVTFSVSSTFGLPTGVVSVTVSDSFGICDDTLTDGSGSCQLTITDTGTYTLTANYNGNATYSPSSDSEVHIVSEPGSKLCLPLILNYLEH
jgi:CSLREA domain-containing protein